MSLQRKRFGDIVAVGQVWEHKKSGEQAMIEQVHRKDKQVKLRYRPVNRSGRARSTGAFDGDFEYRTFELFQKYYRLYSWGQEQINA